MLKLEHVSKYYNTANNVTLGLHNVSVELKKGEIVAVTGESGSGKSTFLNVITGMDSYEDGEMFYNGEETSFFNNEDFEKYRKDNVGFIFQNYNLVESYNVIQNVMLPLLLRGYSKKEAKEKAIEIIKVVGLEKRIKHKGTQLSGGEAQRVSIARAIASDSPILACDEPTGNLDSATGKEIISLIKKVSEGRLVVIVTHNYDEVKDIVTRKLTFHDGEIVEDLLIKETEEKETKTNPIDYNIRKRDLFSFALKNIGATPKKTIFTSAVFIVATLIICSLVGLMTYSNKQDGISNYSYNNSNPNRVIVFSKEGLDNSLIEEKLPNATLVKESSLEDNISINLSYDMLDYLYCCVDYSDGPSKLLYGKRPENDKEILLGIKKGDLNYYYKYYNSVTSDGLKITGFYDYDTKSDYLIVSFNNKEARVKYLTKNYLNALSNKVTYSFKAYSYEFSNSSYDENAEKTIVTIPEEIFEIVKNGSLVSKYYDKETIVQNVVYEKGTDWKIKYGKDFIKFFDNNEQISLYANNKISVKKIVETVESLGYLAFVPSKISAGTDVGAILFKMFLIVTSFLIMLAILPVYFISYLVLSRVYASKNKDYAVMRTLGVKKKEMALIVEIELGFICIIMSVFVFAVLKILSVTVRGEFFVIYDCMNIGNVIFYFLAIFLFAFFMGGRFNKKLFCFTVNSTMKKEALEND